MVSWTHKQRWSTSILRRKITWLIFSEKT